MKNIFFYKIVSNSDSSTVSSIIAVAWILCSLLKDEGFLVAATAFAGIFQGFVVLVTILPFIIKGLLRKEQFQVDSMSVVDGDSGRSFRTHTFFALNLKCRGIYF